MKRTLSARERQVVALLATGAKQKQIAQQLGVSERTIEAQVRSARRKTGAASSWELAVRAAAGSIGDEDAAKN